MKKFIRQIGLFFLFILLKPTVNAGPNWRVMFNTSEFAGYSISCYGAMDGWIEAYIIGTTTQPYTLSWSHSNTILNDTDVKIKYLGTGWYILTINDSLNLESKDSIFLSAGVIVLNHVDKIMHWYIRGPAQSLYDHWH
jgi:hypothetical protein